MNMIYRVARAAALNLTLDSFEVKLELWIRATLQNLAAIERSGEGVRGTQADPRLFQL